ncbi:DUF5712 family protein [Rufibacter tibetensis]|uniref:DUF5712 family protein n=1 Tax=Rufibacter tibetensis TaxID=512763 RepID=UPI0007853E3B|nr:DUF5712 family protein [Rufibacter tibetensis]
MYVKLVNPKIHGKTAYNNKGSCQQTLNYLIHEAKREAGEYDIFFDQTKDNLRLEIVRNAIDNNVKGLRSHQEKFFSLIIAPSETELRHIKNSDQLLRNYTRQVMELYASNFNLKEGRRLQSKNLLWFAAIHLEREYRGNDSEVLAGNARVGERRPGLQTHLHVIVSARDREQKITLNPGGRRGRFNLMNWQTACGRQFENQFNYSALETEKLRPRQRDSSRDAARAKRIGERVEALNLLLPKSSRLDGEQVKQIAVSRQYDKTFYRSLKHLEEVAREGLPLQNPYHLLRTGREKVAQQTSSRLQARHLLHAFRMALQPREDRSSHTEDIGERKGKRKGEIEIE